MLLYNDISFLNYSEFKDRTLVRIDDFSFASATGSVPLIGIEFVEAAKEFPVVFFKNSAGEYIPAVLLGTEEKRNYVVSKEGEWQAWFVPAYIHRYPFLSLAGEKEDSLKICIDGTYSGLDAEGGEPLFQEGGKPGLVLERAMKLMQKYHFQMTHTVDFCQRLSDHGLLQEKELHGQYIREGEPETFTVAGTYSINEEKLLALDQEKVMDYFIKGEMAWIYSHLISLTNLSRVVDAFPPED